MQEGLYKVVFETQRGAGAGCVVLADGRIRGGDAGMYYVGTYELSGSEIRSNLTVDRHTNFPGMVSVFGVDKVQVLLVGKVEGHTIEAQGSAPQAPGLTFRARLTLIAE